MCFNILRKYIKKDTFRCIRNILTLQTNIIRKKREDVLKKEIFHNRHEKNTHQSRCCIVSEKVGERLVKVLCV